MADEGEMVRVTLGDDYYQGPCFSLDSSGEYLVSRSRLDRWEEVMAAYGEMQGEVMAVMDEQRERVMALRAERPKSKLSQWVQDIYGPLVQIQLKQNLEIAKARYEDDTPWLATDSKIDRWEEEQGL